MRDTEGIEERDEEREIRVQNENRRIFSDKQHKKVCEGLMSDYKKDNGNQVNSNFADYANDLNRLYPRFDCHDFGFEPEGIRDRLANRPTQEQGEITVSEEEVPKVLKNQVKQSGKTRLGQNKCFENKLYEILCHIFNFSLSH